MKNERGVTLIEMVLSIILIGIIGIIASELFLGSTKTVLTGNAVREAAQVNRLALDRMVREIRTVRDNKCVAVGNDKQFTFVDSQNKTIEFSWSGTSGDPLTRTENGGAPDVLVNQVSSLVFTYFNNDWTVPTPPGTIASPLASPNVCASPNTCSPTLCSATNLWEIEVDLTTQSGTETMQLRSRVHPRSF